MTVPLLVVHTDGKRIIALCPDKMPAELIARVAAVVLELASKHGVTLQDVLDASEEGTMVPTGPVPVPMLLTGGAG